MKTFKQFLKEKLYNENMDQPAQGGMNQVAGIGDDDENFHVKFTIKDLIAKAQKYPTKDVPISTLLPFLQGRQEDHSQTQARADMAELQYPIIVIANDQGKIFAIADGTHRVQKADALGMTEIKSHIIPKNDMAEFAVK
jgi:hypothetical protein